MDYPFSVLFTCKTDPLFAQLLSNINDTLDPVSARTSISWEVEVHLKRKKKNKLLDGSLGTEKIFNNSSLYFVRFYDCDKCCAVPRLNIDNGDEIKKVQSSLVGDFHLEEVLSSAIDLVGRSSWRIVGKRYLYNNFVIGIGYVEHGNDIPFPIIEICSVVQHNSYSHTLFLISQFLHNHSPAECKDPGKFMHYHIIDNTENERRFTLLERAVIWTTALTGQE